MKSFKQYMKEETMPYANVRSGSMDIKDSAVRDQINQLLAGVTADKAVTPYIVLERVAKVLANFHIYIPSQHFMEGESGAMVWPINQFGAKAGMNNQGQFVVSGGVGKDETHGPHMGGEGSYIAPTVEKNDYSIFFEYRQGDCGMFTVFCEVVDNDELDEIMTDLEAELNDEGEEDEDELNEAVSDYNRGKFAIRQDAYKDEDGDIVHPVYFGPRRIGHVSGNNKDGWKYSHNKRGSDSGFSSKATAYDALKNQHMNVMNKQQKMKEESGYYYGKQKVTELKMSDEQQIDEISSKIVKKYVKAAEKDKKHADRQADFSEYESNRKDLPADRKKAFKGEAEWIKGISAKRAKGLEMAKKRLGEEPINEDDIERKRNALWKMIDYHNKKESKTKDLKANHHRKMSDQLRGELLSLQGSEKKDEPKKQINEVSKELVGKVNKARMTKPSKTTAGAKSLNRAVIKKWLDSNVGKLIPAKEEPPFEPTEKKSTPYANPKAKAKQLARMMMRKNVAEERDPVAPETGPRKTPGSNQPMSVVASVADSLSKTLKTKKTK